MAFKEKTLESFRAFEKMTAKDALASRGRTKGKTTSICTLSKRSETELNPAHQYFVFLHANRLATCQGNQWYRAVLAVYTMFASYGAFECLQIRETRKLHARTR